MGMEAKLNGKNVVDTHSKRGRSRLRMRRRSSQAPKGSLVDDVVAPMVATKNIASSSKTVREIVKPPSYDEALVCDDKAPHQIADAVAKLPAADTSLPEKYASQIFNAKLPAAGISLSERNGPKIDDAVAKLPAARTPLPEKHAPQIADAVAHVPTAGTSLPAKNAMQPPPAVALGVEDTLYSDSEDDGNVMNQLLGESLVETVKLSRTVKGKASVPTEAERMAALAEFFSDFAADEETFVDLKTKKKHKEAKKKGKGSKTSSSQ